MNSAQCEIPEPWAVTNSDSSGILSLRSRRRQRGWDIGEAYGSVAHVHRNAACRRVTSHQTQALQVRENTPSRKADSDGKSS